MQDNIGEARITLSIVIQNLDKYNLEANTYV